MKEKLNKLSASFGAFKEKFVKKMEKPVKVMKKIFGWGIMISLFVGAATLLGYLAAFIIGGEAAVAICAFIKKHIIPAVTYISTVMVIFGIVIMYFSGEVALAANKKSAKKNPDAKDERLDEGER